MTIIVVGDETYTTSMVPREQHEREDHDADPTTEAHDFTDDVTIGGTLTCADVTASGICQATQIRSNGDAVFEGPTTFMKGTLGPSGSNTLYLDCTGINSSNVTVTGICQATEIKSTGNAIFEGPVTYMKGDLRAQGSHTLDIECDELNCTHTFFTGRIEGPWSNCDIVTAQTINCYGTVEAEDHVSAGKAGQFNTLMHTFPNSQRHLSNFIECKNVAHSNLFQVDGYGSATALSVTAEAGFGTSQDGNFSWAHTTGAGLLRLGRQQNLVDTTGVWDGIHHQRTIGGVTHTFNQQLHPTEPKLQIKGETNSGVDWFQIVDDDNEVVYAIHDDGTVQTRANSSVDIEHPDVHGHTIATSAASVYIGRARLSELEGRLFVSHLKAPPYIPATLTQAPYNFNSGNINVNTNRSIQDWMVLARDQLTGAAKKNLRIRDIFPVNQQGWDFEHTEGYPIKDYEGYNRVWLRCDTLAVDKIVPKTGNSLKEINVRQIKTKPRSVWLGEKTHLATDSGVATIQYRKDTIPAYLAALGVVEADVIALGTTVADCTLDQWVALSLAATPTAGSDDLSDIFPIANTAADFTVATTLNQLIITPTHTNSSSGIEVVYPSGGHPLINLRGSTGAGNGHGMIQFNNDQVATANIYSSGTDGHLHFGVENSKNVEIDAVDLVLNGTSVVNAPVTQEIFCDASYSGAVSTGSRDQPYTSLSTAMAGKLTDGSSTHYVFKLAPGTYRGAISITHTNQLQSVSVIGSGSGCTFLDTAADWSSQLTSNVLYLRNFNDIEIQGVTFTRGAYGLYLRHCKSATVTNCNFEKLGSKGTVSQHDLSQNQASQAAYWAGNNTSDGGACRLREVNTVQFNDNSISYCLRGGRFQDCGEASTASMISGNKVYRTLESGLYLAAGSYTGTDGCLNVTISGNSVYESFNNSILVIGGKKCSVVGNTCIGGANAGIQCWHVLDCGVFNNHVFDCARLSFNGIGSLADSYASICVDGATNIGTGTYIAILKGNSTTKCNQGRAAAVYGIAIFPNDTSLAYPTPSNKLILNSNISDAANREYNPNSITVTEVEESSGGGGGNLGATATVTSTSGESQLTIESLDPNPGTTDKVSLQFKMDHSGTAQDYTYVFENQSTNDLQMAMINPAGTKKNQIRLTSAGGVLIGQNIAGFNGHSDCVIQSARIVSDLVFHATLFNDTPASETASAERGTFLIDDSNLWYRTATEWKKSPLQDFDYTTPAPLLERNTTHMNPGNYSSWPLLTGVTVFIHDTGANSSRYRLPEFPVDGQVIDLFLPNSSGGLNIHTGAFQVGGTYRMMHTNSVGKSGNYQCNLVGTNRYKAVFIEATQKWLIL